MGWLYRDSDFTWFDARFDEFQRYLPYVKSTVRLSSKVSEKVSREPKQHINEERTGMVWQSNYCEAVAVYNSMFIDGPLTGREAIVKIFMQWGPPKICHVRFLYDSGYADDARIPNVGDADNVSGNPEDYAHQAEDESREAGFEVVALETLTDAGCSSTPELYDYGFESYEKSTNPWIKGGFLTVVAMEKVPGVPVIDVWDLRTLSEEQQYRIQSAFKTAMIDVFDHDIVHGDPRLENLIWDAENGKCYIIDFEDSDCPDGKRSESPNGAEGVQRPAQLRRSGQEMWDDEGCYIYSRWGLRNQWVADKLRELRDRRDRAVEEGRDWMSI